MGGGVKFYDSALPRTAENSDVFEPYDNIVNDKRKSAQIILDLSAKQRSEQREWAGKDHFSFVFGSTTI